VPLTDVHELGVAVEPEDAGRRVTVDGRFDPARQVVVVNRQNDGESGSWVVTALEVAGDGSADAAIPVVRGWLPNSHDVPPPPEGNQAITGWLEPSESDVLRNGVPLSDGQLEIVSSPELLSLWRPPLYQGFVVQQQPTPNAPLIVVEPPVREAVVTNWQNAAYAVQWWLFGLFAIFWFVRMVRLEAEDRAPRPDKPGDNDLDRMGPSGESPHEEGAP
jgi:cytochrome oxidase assembly protein ShyY1